MPRQARIVIPELPHHITQRGNYQQVVFDSEVDYKQYCEWINEYTNEYNLDILAYCLMPNHVHFIAIPHAEDALAKTFNTAHMRYSHYLNKRRGVKGHLWQGRFYSCILDDAHLYRAIRYVEKNPMRAKMVKQPWDYDYSSAKDHLRQREGEPLIKLNLEYQPIQFHEWKEYLQEGDPGICNEMRLKTSRGLVIGTQNFINTLEKRLNRSLKCYNQGRPKKEG